MIGHVPVAEDVVSFQDKNDSINEAFSEVFLPGKRAVYDLRVVPIALLLGSNSSVSIKSCETNCTFWYFQESTSSPLSY